MSKIIHCLHISYMSIQKYKERLKLSNPNAIVILPMRLFFTYAHSNATIISKMKLFWDDKMVKNEVFEFWFTWQLTKKKVRLLANARNPMPTFQFYQTIISHSPYFRESSFTYYLTSIPMNNILMTQLSYDRYSSFSNPILKHIRSSSFMCNDI